MEEDETVGVMEVIGGDLAEIETSISMPSELGMSANEQMLEKLQQGSPAESTESSNQVEKAKAALEKATQRELATVKERQENMERAVEIGRHLYRLDGDEFYHRTNRQVFNKNKIDFAVVPIITDNGGKRHPEAFNMYLKGTQSLRGVEFRPVKEEFIKKEDGKYVNSFRGFPFNMKWLKDYFPEEDPHCEFNYGIDPATLPPPDPHSEIEHFLFSNICSENAEATKFLMAYIHQILTEPMEKHAFVPVFQGPQGTGKSTMFRLLKRILGECHVYSVEPHDLESQYNDALAGRLVLFADEATFSGDVRMMNKLKNMTGGSVMRIEGKYASSRSEENYIRLIIATNEEWAAPVEKDNRRYILFKTCSSGKINFKRLYEELKSDKAVANFLRKVNAIGHAGYDFHSNNPPVFFQDATDSLKMETMLKIDPVGAWLADDVDDDESLEFIVKTDGFITSSRAYDLFLNWKSRNSTSHSREVTQCKFSIEIQKRGFQKTVRRLNGSSSTTRCFEKS